MFTYTPRGVCSHEMRVSIDDENRIEDIQVFGGCQGNLTSAGRALQGTGRAYNYS